MILRLVTATEAPDLPAHQRCPRRDVRIQCCVADLDLLDMGIQEGALLVFLRIPGYLPVLIAQAASAQVAAYISEYLLQ